MSHHDLDPIYNISDNEHFQDVLSQSLQNPARRGLLRGGLGLAGLAMLPGCASMVSGVAAAPSALGFPSLDKSLLDNVILPPGYQYTVLHATGDALDSSLPAYSNKGIETDDWSRRIGDHHDGMDIYYFVAYGR
jgi:secreted PhoX family phosphatase